jgi:hypothetical protein
MAELEKVVVTRERILKTFTEPVDNTRHLVT